MSYTDTLNRQDSVEAARAKLAEAEKLIKEVMDFVDSQATDWEGVATNTGHSCFHGPAYFVRQYCDVHNELDDAQAAVSCAGDTLDRLAVEAGDYADECGGVL